MTLMRRRPNCESRNDDDDANLDGHRCFTRIHFIVFIVTMLGISVWRDCFGVEASSTQRRLSATNLEHHQLQQAHDDYKTTSNDSFRILYIVTSLAEYNSGTRATEKGSDRLQQTLIPILAEGVDSMIAMGYHVDVFLISHWKVLPERLQLIRDALHWSVGLQVWDDAMPIGYEIDDKSNRTRELSKHLARQHRFVIKDKLLEYDFFIAMEDDMLIHADHVQHFRNMSQKLVQLRKVAPESVPVAQGTNAANVFYGPLTKSQLSRLVPGLMRVEVLLDEANYGTQTKLAPIPVDLDFNGTTRSFDPKPCCHVAQKTVNEHIPASPPADKVFMWETGIEGLSVREIPGLGFVAFLGGASGFKADPVIGDYWSGRDKDFGDMKRPRGPQMRYVSNQGGFMATRQQILEWHSDICMGSFLPPFDDPHYRFDGLDMRNVEYWSGGLNLFTYRHACNLQRIVSLQPDGFSRHLIYHSANNKQTQLNRQGQVERFVKINNLLGQLNTVRKRAEETKRKEEHTKAQYNNTMTR